MVNGAAASFTKATIRGAVMREHHTQPPHADVPEADRVYTGPDLPSYRTLLMEVDRGVAIITLNRRWIRPPARRPRRPQNAAPRRPSWSTRARRRRSGPAGPVWKN